MNKTILHQALPIGATSGPRRPGPRRGFTLTEMLVSLGVLSLILVLTTTMVSGTQQTLRTARANAEQFREARRAFETITRRLSQATLNTYWDYDDPDEPKRYLRQSELHFVTGPSKDLVGGADIYGHSIFFIAPFGYAGSDATGHNPGGDPYRNLETLLNAWGYYVTWSSQADVPPFIRERQEEGIISRSDGFRLVEFRQPSERLGIYKDKLKDRETLSRGDAYKWFKTAVNQDLGGNIGGPPGSTTSRVVAENIIALVIRPVISPEDAKNNDISSGKDVPWEIAPEYLFDSRQFQWGSKSDPVVEASRNQVPPVLELTLVALDDKTFRLYQSRHNEEGQEKIANLLDGLFEVSEDLEDDLDTLEEGLDELQIGYRVFQASVGLRTAKWSDSQPDPNAP